jgi:flagellar biosynthesis protein
MTQNNTSSESQANKAIALKYDEITAPKLTAKGHADIAEQIIQLAKEHNIPIYENSELVNILSKLELGDEIPETLYRVIAEIIAFAYHLQGKVPKGFSTEHNH